MFLAFAGDEDSWYMDMGYEKFVTIDSVLSVLPPSTITTSIDGCSWVVILLSSAPIVNSALRVGIIMDMVEVMMKVLLLLIAGLIGVIIGKIRLHCIL